MEYLDGVKLVDGIRNQYKLLADHIGISLEAMEAEHAAIEFGNYEFQTIEQTKKERFKMQWYYACYDYLINPNNIWKVLYNISVFRLFYGPVTDFQRTPLPVDLGATLELLCHVHANELFEHGSLCTLI